MVQLRRTHAFIKWQLALRDQRAIERIASRLVRMEYGLFGDAKIVGDKVWELRIDYGPGYRVYFMRQGEDVILLLLGGDKSSQKRDIQRAIAMAKMIGDHI